MTDQNGEKPRSKGPFLVPVLALGMVLAIFGGIVGVSSFQLRKDLRGEIVQRHADIWAPISQFHVAQGMEDELLGILEFEDTVAYSLMSAQEIEGALGIQVFGAEGRFLDGIPFVEEELVLDPTELERLRGREPWGRFVSDLNGRPEVELNIPVFDPATGQLAAMARYFMDGEPMRREFNEVDRNLAWQATLAFGSGTVLLSAVLLWSFWRLRRAHNEVAERAARLSEANAELAMVAKTSAIGAVASHLIHGLKNPLAGIRQQFASNSDQLESGDWDDARQATLRMQSMVNEVVDVLKNEQFDEKETLSGEEICGFLRSKFESRVEEKELDIGFWSQSGVSLSARDANIAQLIVSNLIDNAIDAVAVGGEVEARIAMDKNRVVFRIVDTGPGFSEDARKNLFAPVQSGKAKGAGIGLAISKQLARHLGADLELVRSSSLGSEIRLSVPARKLSSIL